MYLEVEFVQVRSAAAELSHSGGIIKGSLADRIANINHISTSTSKMLFRANRVLYSFRVTLSNPRLRCYCAMLASGNINEQLGLNLLESI